MQCHIRTRLQNIRPVRARELSRLTVRQIYRPPCLPGLGVWCGRIFQLVVDVVDGMSHCVYRQVGAHSQGSPLTRVLVASHCICRANPLELWTHAPATVSCSVSLLLTGWTAARHRVMYKSSACRHTVVSVLLQITPATSRPCSVRIHSLMIVQHNVPQQREPQFDWWAFSFFYTRTYIGHLPTPVVDAPHSPQWGEISYLSTLRSVLGYIKLWSNKSIYKNGSLKETETSF